MDSNQQPDRSMESPHATNSRMKTRVVWFVLGFVLSWGVWSAVSYTRGEGQDYTQSWPDAMQEMAPEWTKQAKGRTQGRFTVIASADSQNASAMIYPTPPNQFPGVVYEDQDSDGQVDWLLVADANHRSFSLDVANGRFESCTYSTGLADSITFQDANMDGQYDDRIGPGKERAVMIESAWRDLIVQSNDRYVDLNGMRTPLKQVDGVWMIANEGL